MVIWHLADIFIEINYCLGWLGIVSVENIENESVIEAEEEEKRKRREDAQMRKIKIREEDMPRVRSPSNLVLSLSEILFSLWEILGRTFHTAYVK